VYEDSDLLILNKNSGTPSVPHAFDETETAVGSALSHLPSLAGVGRGGLEPGLLHRLDTGTSGLLAFAKTNEVFERLRLDWKNGNVRKLYRAWVHGDAETLRLPMPLELTLAHHPESQKRMIVIPEGVQRKYRGKPLQTQTTLLKCFSKLEARGGIFSDVEVEIQTGVMHQIRCTLAYLNLAVVGDPIYGKPSDMAQPRLLLHAWKLSIPSPSRPGYRIEIEAPLPTDFRPCLA
jgi:23S rRNA pseudouridine1911/1915/1917 synthase